MLLNFSCYNFKSFRNGFPFNMVPEARMRELEYSILTETVAGKTERGLSASVLYGPNAAGKTSVVRAMSCMRQIVLRGNVRDASGDCSGLFLVPFAFREDSAPVRFDATFTSGGMKFRYALAVWVGAFLERGAERYIDREQLYVNDMLVFDRSKDAVNTLKLDGIADDLNVGYARKDTEKTRMAMSANVTADSLLLVSDFNAFCSKKLVREILRWFEEKLIIVNASDRMRSYPAVPIEDGQMNAFLNRIAQEAGIVGSDFAYTKDPETHAPKLVSVFPEVGGIRHGLDADRIESAGIMRLFSIMPAIITALQKGAVLVLDELDASLHPMIVTNLITIFHNTEVNRKGAQIIFNTHNPIYLNHNLLRRDEIKFVERDRESKSSLLYALSDFRANGDVSVRKTSDYLRNYFAGRYGAIEDIDFTDIIADLLESGQRQES